MTTIESIASEFTALREFVAHLADRHIDRHEMARRLGVSPATVDRRAKAGSIPAPINGKWLLSSVVAWEIAQTRDLPQPSRQL